MQDLEKLSQIIESSDNIVFFGGAGVSTASGIPDFRGSHGLYNYTPEEIISHHFFMNHTKEFYDFYCTKMLYPEAKPNACHYFLTKLEQIGKLKAIVTQNIDGLHQKAGSKKVIEIHGTVSDNHCMRCGKYYPLDELDLQKNYFCDCGGIIKPDVVLYEEALNSEKIREAINYISKAKTLIVAGTSLVVYPAASFVRYFNGQNLVIINLGVTNLDSRAGLVINGKVEEYLNLEKIKL